MFGLDRTDNLGQNKAMKDKRTPLPKAEKAVASFAKTDVRYWRDKLFQRSNDEWNCRIGFGARQDRWPLRTTNREQAALKARDIWLSLQTHGFPLTEAKFKPWTVAPKQTPAESVTVGDFIKAAKAQPGKLNIGSIAVGATQNLGAELLKSLADIKVPIVPYKRSPDIVVAL